MNIEIGDVCLCSRGNLGLVTEDGKKEVTYRDGNKAIAYCGIHLLEDKENCVKPGDPWSST